MRHPRHRQRRGGHPHGAGRCAVFVLRYRSLLGVKLAKPITNPESCRANFTNEGGVGYIRYLKNIMGLWIIQCVQKQLGISFAEMVELAKTSTYTRIFDVNAARFSAPQDMRAEIEPLLPRPVKPLPRMPTSSTHLPLAGVLLRRSPSRDGSRDRPALGQALHRRRRRKERHPERADRPFTGKQVVALPIEATAIGNLKIQMNIQ